MNETATTTSGSGFLLLWMISLLFLVSSSSSFVILQRQQHRYPPSPYQQQYPLHASSTPAGSSTTTTTPAAGEDDDDDDAASLSSYNLGDWTTQSFNMDLYNLAMEDPFKAEDAVDVMREFSNNTTNTTTSTEQQQQQLPNAATYAILVDGYLQAGDVDAAESVVWKHKDVLLSQQQHHHHHHYHHLYMLIMQAWANYDLRNDRTAYGARRGEAMLRRWMKEVLPITTTTTTATTNTTRNSTTSTNDLLIKLWSIAVEGWCKRVGLYASALTNAERLWDEIVHKNKNVQPNILTATTYIVGLSKSRRPGAARAATALLNEHGAAADVVAYTAVLNCWAKTVDRDERRQAVDQALALLDRLEEETSSTSSTSTVQPNAIVYATAIAAIGNALDCPRAPDVAASILLRMQRNSGIKPVTETYNAYLYALGRLPGHDHVERARALLDKSHDTTTMPSPNVRTWAAVLRVCAWEDAPEVAAEVLQEMEEREDAPTPNTVCYTTVMRAWAKSSAPDALEQMERILGKMERLYEETQSPDLRPNAVSYLTYIEAIVRRNPKESPERVTEVVNRMRLLHQSGKGYLPPNRDMFNALMQSWSLADRPDAPRRVEQIFQWMEQKYEKEGDVDMRPDEVSLCATLNAWANNAEWGGAERAVSIWRHSESLSNEERGFEPSVAMPNIVIKALARSNDPNSVVMAEKILLELEAASKAGKTNLTPDVRTFSSVINACAYCSGGQEERGEALAIALRTFQKMGKTAAPNTVTYGTLMKAVNNLMPISSEREELVDALFRRCCKEGCVGFFVLSQLKLVAPQTYRDLAAKVGSTEVFLERLPQSWTKNRVD